MGTGMENPGRYYHMIYYKDLDTIFVNLFINSTVQWDEGDMALTQTTDFPVKDTTTITVNAASGSEKTISLRVPGWTENVTVKVNGNEVFAAAENGYIAITREWKKGDTITYTTADGGFTATCVVTVKKAPVPNTYTITAAAGEGGTINPGTAAVTENENQTFIIAADKGYAIADVLVDGQSVGAVESYTFFNVKDNHTITASFVELPVEPEPEPYTVTVLGFACSESGAGSYEAGETVTVKAGSRSSCRFGGWVTEDVVLDDPNSATTTFTMPEKDVTVQAKWILVPGTGTGDGKPPIITDPVTPVTPDTDFVDVSPTDWYAEAVAYVSENGLMTGVGNGKFNPDGAVTRVMVWTVLARMAGENTEGGATWYSKAQAWAVETGVSDGTNPTGSITREQLAAMRMRFTA